MCIPSALFTTYSPVKNISDSGGKHQLVKNEQSSISQLQGHKIRVQNGTEFDFFASLPLSILKIITDYYLEDVVTIIDGNIIKKYSHLPMWLISSIIGDAALKTEDLHLENTVLTSQTLMSVDVLCSVLKTVHISGAIIDDECCFHGNVFQKWLPNRYNQLILHGLLSLKQYARVVLIGNLFEKIAETLSRYEDTLLALHKEHLKLIDIKLFQGDQIISEELLLAVSNYETTRSQLDQLYKDLKIDRNIQRAIWIKLSEVKRERCAHLFAKFKEKESDFKTCKKDFVDVFGVIKQLSFFAKIIFARHFKEEIMFDDQNELDEFSKIMGEQDDIDRLNEATKLLSDQMRQLSLQEDPVLAGDFEQGAINIVNNNDEATIDFPIEIICIIVRYIFADLLVRTQYDFQKLSSNLKQSTILVASEVTALKFCKLSITKALFQKIVLLFPRLEEVDVSGLRIDEQICFLKEKTNKLLPKNKEVEIMGLLKQSEFIQKCCPNNRPFIDTIIAQEEFLLQSQGMTYEYIADLRSYYELVEFSFNSLQKNWANGEIIHRFLSECNKDIITNYHKKSQEISEDYTLLTIFQCKEFSKDYAEVTNTLMEIRVVAKLAIFSIFNRAIWTQQDWEYFQNNRDVMQTKCKAFITQLNKKREEKKRLQNNQSHSL